MNDKIKAVIEDVLNTVIHATVAAAAAGIPAHIALNAAGLEVAKAWLFAAGAAGLVAGIHALGRILVNVKNAQLGPDINMLASPIDPDQSVWLAQAIMQSAPPESSAHSKALVYLESKVPTV